MGHRCLLPLCGSIHCSAGSKHRPCKLFPHTAAVVRIPVFDVLTWMACFSPIIPSYHGCPVDESSGMNREAKQLVVFALRVQSFVVELIWPCSKLGLACILHLQSRTLKLLASTGPGISRDPSLPQKLKRAGIDGTSLSCAWLLGLCEWCSN